MKNETPNTQRLSSREGVADTGRHACRPVHPECPRIDNPPAPCRCNSRWGIDGETVRVAAAPYDRLDNRTKWGHHISESVPGPDADELDSGDDAVFDENFGLDAYEGGLQSDLEIDGFWKESNFRKQFEDDQ